MTGAALQFQQMQNQRAMALAQMANENQQRQQQNFFDLQKMPMQAAIESQQQAFQYGLQGQNQIQQAQLQGQIHADQAQQNFGYQQQLQDAQQQGQLGNQMEMAKYNDQLKQQQQVEQLFQNPLAQHLQNVQKAQQSGYSFAPEQQQQVDKLKKGIQAIQNDVASRNSFRGTALPELQKRVAQLNGIVPSQPPPETVQQIVDKKVVMGVRGPDGNVIPGTENQMLTVDKDGTPIAVRGTKPAEPGEVNPDTGEVETEKARAQRLKNQKLERDVNLHRTEWVEKHVQAILKNPMAGMDQSGMRDPNFENNLRAAFEHKYDQAAAQTPSGVAPVGSTTRPGQSPTGQPTGSPMGGQAMTSQPPSSPQMGLPAGGAGAAGPPGSRQVMTSTAPETAEGGLPAGGAGAANPSGAAQTANALPWHQQPAPLPSRYAAVQAGYRQAGNVQAADAVQKMYNIVAFFGQNIEKWPPAVRDEYLTLSIQAPDFYRAVRAA